MNKPDAVASFHPAISFLYFGLVLSFAMCLQHPVCIAISLCGAVFYCIRLDGKQDLLRRLRLVLPLALLAGLINLVFNHEGATILGYLPSGNPLTLESINYAIASAAMLFAVLCWFRCCSAVLTSDRLIYLFGRIAPALSLLLSMTLRFVPQCRAQLKAVSNARKGAGYHTTGTGLLTRAKSGLAVLSITVTWMLEDAIQTADSMKSRGYGLRGRTAFSIYGFDKRDRRALLFLLLCGGYVLFGVFFHALYWRYFPVAQGSLFGVYVISVFAAYFVLCIAPALIHGKEDRAWIHIGSTI